MKKDNLKKWLKKIMVCWAILCCVKGCVVYASALDESDYEYMDLIQEGAVVIPEEDYSFDETCEEALEETSIPYESTINSYLSSDTNEQKLAQQARSNDNATLEDRKAACALALYNAMINLSYGVNVSAYALTKAEFVNVISDVINSNPELFYIAGKFSVSTFSLSSEDDTEIVRYCCAFYEYTIAGTNSPDKNKIVKLQQELENKKQEILSEIIVDEMSDAEKALVIHDYIVLNTEYDYSAYLEYMSSSGDIYDYLEYGDFDIYGTLMNGKAVCQGYALTYKYLLEAAGVEDIGFSSSATHVWNTITLGEDSYYVDCTWDDPTWDTLGNVKHSYFLKGATEFKRTHTIVDTDRECDGAAYDNAFWCDVYSAVIYYKDAYYYIGNDGNLYRKAMQWDETLNEEAEQVLSLNLEETASWDYKNGAKLAMANSNILYHDGKNIYFYNLEKKDGGIACQPDLEEDELIYGIRYQNGVFEYATRSQNYQYAEQKIYTYQLPSNIVVIPVSAIEITGPTQINLTKNTSGYISEKITLTAKVLPDNASDRRIRKWTSSDTSVAVVDINGVVKGIGPGTVVITATCYDGSVTGEYSVNVVCNETTTEQEISKTSEEAVDSSQEAVQENNTAEAPKYVGWKEIKGKRYYYDKNGVMTTGWKTIKKKKYYFDKNGVMITGWKTIKKKKYYFNKNGVMTTGWKTIKKKKYYFNKKGVMQTGWKTIKKKKYYFNKKGVMQTGWVTIKKKQYYFAKDGHLVR
jgi:glucan-binding YG repeat protein